MIGGQIGGQIGGPVGGTEGLVLSPDEVRRAQLVDRLAVTGAAGIPKLVEMLDDPSWTVRRAVVAALSSMDTQAEEPLCQALASRRENEARIAATVDALSAIRGNGESAALRRLADSAEPAVVADVAHILGRRRSPAAVTTLIRLTKHADDNVAVAAIEGLGRIGGPTAVDALIEAVRSGNFFRIFPAIDVLGRSGDPRAVAPLGALIDKPQYASEAARALGRTGDHAAVPELAGLLARGAVALVRLGAVSLVELRQRHLERFGSVEAVDHAIRNQPGRTTAARNLVRALSEGDAHEQAAMALLLGMLGDGSVVPALTPLLDAAPPVGAAVAEALRTLGPDADATILEGIASGTSGQKCALLALVSRPGAAGQVLACLADSDPDVRVAACAGLGRMGHTAAAPELFPLLGDANARVSFAAAAAIQSLGSPGTEELALAAARSSEARVRRAAMRVLAYFGFPSALEVFLAALSDPDEKVREAALQGLPFVEDVRAVDALFEAARSPAERTRATAMRALGQCTGDPRITAFLLKGLSDPDAWVRYYACQSLGRLAFQPAAPAMIQLLNDPAGQVRVAAVEGLSCLKSAVALQALRQATRDADADIQRAALVGLGVAKDQESLPVMVSAAASEDAATRLVALSAIAGLTPSPEVVRVLGEAARDTNETVRVTAVNFLSALPGLAATSMLVELLGHAPQPDKIVAALATDNGDRVPGLVSALGSADDQSAPYITSALARLHLPEASAALVAAMAGPNVSARKAVASALAVLSSREALAALGEAAARDPDMEVRQICSLLLAR